jgi:D-glycero-alpha-D-manno-heptose-7-phosphate kinase
MDLSKKLDKITICASAPCRIDMGGTLDLSTFYYPLRYLEPCTFNAAINLRTQVILTSYDTGRIKISSKGFKAADYPANEAPFDHPLGLMFAVATFFHAHGVHIQIVSTSPPKSALGGSSSAAVALVAAKQMVENPLPVSLKTIGLLAHGLEQSVAGIPCGIQDQLAAVFGGINAWYWTGDPGAELVKQKAVLSGARIKAFERSLLLAYCGVPHISKDTNSRWVKDFVAGRFRKEWGKIVRCTQRFVDALEKENYKEASRMMNCETQIRKKMTPDVLNEMGEKLVFSAIEHQCGARFTGAGAGGCIWALGKPADINRLKDDWRLILVENKEARLLDVGVDTEGLNCSNLKLDSSV